MCSSILHLIKNSSEVFLDRVINKFKENDFEKIERMVELFRIYYENLKEVEAEYSIEEKIKILKEYQPDYVLISFIKITVF